MNTKRCADWDYTKKDGTKSCWDRPGVAWARRNSTTLSTGSGGPKVGTRVTFATRSSARSPARPTRMEDDQKQALGDGQEIRPSGLEPTRHRQRRPTRGGVVHYMERFMRPTATVPHKSLSRIWLSNSPHMQASRPVRTSSVWCAAAKHFGNCCWMFR